jgi:hypothetical protein
MDATGDVAGDTRWLTYKEMAAALGIDEESARRRAQRRKWPRREGNDGKARVAVPVDLLTRQEEVAARGDAGDDAGDDAPDVPPDIAAALALVAQMAADTAAAHALADRRGEELAGLRQRVGQAEGEAAVLRQRVNGVEQWAARLEAERDAIRAEFNAWTAGGPLVRAWRAFLNRRR